VNGEEITCAESGEYDAVMRLRTALEDAEMISCVVKREDKPAVQDKLQYIGVRKLPVDDIFFTQNSISPYFRDGRRLETLIDDLCSGRADLGSDGLRIQVMEWPGRGFLSLDNRRVYCFKRYQDLCAGAVVRVRAQVWRLPSGFTRLVEDHRVMGRFLRNFETPAKRLPRIRWSRREGRGRSVEPSGPRRRAPRDRKRRASTR